MPRLRSLVLALALTAAAATTAAAQEVRTRIKKGAFEDVKFELTNAIVNRGLVVDYTGRVGDMLARTGKDVGSDKQIYKAAEYLTFCSAKLSRATMEADAAAIAYCPYVIFIYETAAKPGEIVVGYRAPAAPAKSKARAALAAVDKLLGDIIREAAK